MNCQRFLERMLLSSWKGSFTQDGKDLSHKILDCDVDNYPRVSCGLSGKSSSL